MNIRSILATSLAAFCIAGATVPSNAALIAADDARFGPQSITRDTATGLEWLDLFHTAFASYDSVTRQLGPSGIFEGWRYASLAEVGQLFRNAGIPDITAGGERPRQTTANYLPVLALIDLVGATYSFGCFTLDCPEAEGITGTSVPGDATAEPAHYLASLAACGACGTFDEIHNLGSAALGIDSVRDHMDGDWPGSWLVRQSVPAEIAEPGALLLLGGGLLALARLGSRRGKVRHGVTP